MRYLLGVDVGSYSTKGTLLSSDGAIVGVATHAHEMGIPAPGLAEHDAQKDWWSGFTFVTRQLLAQTGIAPSDIVGIGCSGIGPCMLPVDVEGTPLRQAVLYGIDTRASAEIDEMTAHYGLDLLMRECGGSLTTQAVGPKVLWLARHEPENFTKTAKIVGCPTYLVHRLTGRYVVDHYGASTHLPFYDIGNLRWDVGRVKDALRVDQLPDIGWTCDIAGRVTAQAAVQTGLKPGTPVIVGTVDSAAEAASVGVLNCGDLMVQYGTSIFFIQVIPELHRDARHWSAPYLFPDTWAAMGGVSTGGALTHWLNKIMAPGGTREDAFAALSAEAKASPPGANGLLVLPYFSGERTPINDPKARGMFFGLNLLHQRADLYRAMLEGVGHATRHNLDMFNEIMAFDEVNAVGGGVLNEMWLQSSVDICGKVNRVRQHTLGAAMGSAFLAGVGVGEFERQDIERINPVVASIHPRPEFRPGYDADHQTYLALYQATKQWMGSRAG